MQSSVENSFFLQQKRNLWNIGFLLCSYFAITVRSQMINFLHLFWRFHYLSFLRPNFQKKVGIGALTEHDIDYFVRTTQFFKTVRQ